MMGLWSSRHSKYVWFGHLDITFFLLVASTLRKYDFYVQDTIAAKTTIFKKIISQCTIYITT